MMTNKTTNQNTEWKNTLFQLIFQNNKRFLLSLCNTLNETEYTDEKDITITHINNLLAVRIQNKEISLFQADIYPFSAMTSNIALHHLISYHEGLTDYLQRNNLHPDAGPLIKLPAPRCYLLFDGNEKDPAERFLQLSDIFLTPPSSKSDIGLEWTVHAINLTSKENQTLLDGCKPLDEYRQLVASIKSYSHKLSLEEAVKKSLAENIHLENIGEFLQTHTTDILQIFL